VLFNTGSYVGAMTILMSTGKPLPKFIPSFGWFVEGVVTKGFGRKSLYGTAAMAMGRRKCRWTEADRAMWDAIFELTTGPRDEAVKRGRKAMMR
jgi:UDP-N-acetylglucosamine diphosphorylase / glucose-1-phosphate thymidylyltransferase / UDP-N-acetylgalactosamine diphosphorylase / glucosamine-1-phosphate N-acetyltransferase / galactosamine-1-phosphate N-acetyltransferase